MNSRDLSRNIMAHNKVLYEGHAVAAVAATSQAVASHALELIDVTYEVLPFVIDVEAAMALDAPALHDDLFTAGVDPKPARPSNIAKVVTFKKGDIATAFKEADVVVEGRYTTQPVHQGYIEPHACLATYAPDGQITIHASSQGHFMIRAYTAKLLGIDIANIRVSPTEIGGGFGGKTLIHLDRSPLRYRRRLGGRSRSR
jgi:CO/xanthine dehydrogenase Mo-binding subunit